MRVERGCGVRRVKEGRNCEGSIPFHGDTQSAKVKTQASPSAALRLRFRGCASAEQRPLASPAAAQGLLEPRH
jgi:hypothetical protein